MVLFHFFLRGTIFQEDLKAKHPEDFPGILRLKAPYKAWVILLDAQSPACYINDAKDTGKEPNVEFQQANPGDKLGTKEKPWHSLVTVAALRDIEEGEELLVLPT
jgi:hypothetical protein